MGIYIAGFDRGGAPFFLKFLPLSFILPTKERGIQGMRFHIDKP
jgi:hypothetical protein